MEAGCRVYENVEAKWKPLREELTATRNAPVDLPAALAAEAEAKIAVKNILREGNTTTLVMPKLLAMRDVIAHFPVLVAGVLGAVRNPVLQIFQKYQLDKAQLINNVMSLIHTESGNGSPEVREARLSGWINQVDTSSAKLRNAILVTVTYFHQL